MNYTTNYHLPQWVESDRILMEDFNEAMEAIEEGLSASYTADNPPVVMGWCNVPAGVGMGTVIATFDFTPSFAIVSMGTAALVPQGHLAYIISSVYYLDSSTDLLTLQLSGNQLVCRGVTTKIRLPQKCVYAAFR